MIRSGKYYEVKKILENFYTNFLEVLDIFIPAQKIKIFKDQMFEYILRLSALLFCIGIFGLITSRNMVRALMCLELVFNAVNINFVAFSNFLDNLQKKGEILSIFVLAIAAAEPTIGLAIVLAIYRNRRSIRIDQFDLLKW